MLATQKRKSFDCKCFLALKQISFDLFLKVDIEIELWSVEQGVW